MVELSESVLTALTTRSAKWEIQDAVFHLDNGILGGTFTYTWWFDRALGCLKGLLGECNIDASDLISYFSIEEVSD